MERACCWDSQEGSFRRLYLLRQLKRARLDPHELVGFYTTCIRPVAEDVCETFHNSLPIYPSNELERLQKRAFRIIYPTLMSWLLSINSTTILDYVCKNRLEETSNIEKIRRFSRLVKTAIFGHFAKAKISPCSFFANVRFFLAWRSRLYSIPHMQVCVVGDYGTSWGRLLLIISNKSSLRLMGHWKLASCDQFERKKNIRKQTKKKKTGTSSDLIKFKNNKQNKTNQALIRNKYLLWKILDNLRWLWTPCTLTLLKVASYHAYQKLII